MDTAITVLMCLACVVLGLRVGYYLGCKYTRIPHLRIHRPAFIQGNES